MHVISFSSSFGVLHPDGPTGPYRPSAKVRNCSNLRIETGNASLRRAFRQNDQRPLTIGFDYGDLGTFHPTGDYASMLNSLMGETVRYLPLACEWEEIPEAYKAHIFPTLESYFDLASWYNNQDKVVMGNNVYTVGDRVKLGLQLKLRILWRKNKQRIKADHFTRYGSAEEARNHLPPKKVWGDRTEDEWNNLVDWWSHPDRVARSLQNAANRAKNTILTHQGKKSFAQGRNEYVRSRCHPDTRQIKIAGVLRGIARSYKFGRGAGSDIEEKDQESSCYGKQTSEVASNGLIWCIEGCADVPKSENDVWSHRLVASSTLRHMLFKRPLSRPRILVPFPFCDGHRIVLVLAGDRYKRGHKRLRHILDMGRSISLLSGWMGKWTQASYLECLMLSLNEQIAELNTIYVSETKGNEGKERLPMYLSSVIILKFKDDDFIKFSLKFHILKLLRKAQIVSEEKILFVLQPGFFKQRYTTRYTLPLTGLSSLLVQGLYIVALDEEDTYGLCVLGQCRRRFEGMTVYWSLMYKEYFKGAGCTDSVEGSGRYEDEEQMKGLQQLLIYIKYVLVVRDKSKENKILLLQGSPPSFKERITAQGYGLLKKSLYGVLKQSPKQSRSLAPLGGTLPRYTCVLDCPFRVMMLEDVDRTSKRQMYLALRKARLRKGIGLKRNTNCECGVNIRQLKDKAAETRLTKVFYGPKFKYLDGFTLVIE
ncbi:hypothetical protein Tco_0343265, partial [Tanacetum coccineum]